jgi:hypothetical protein
MRIETLTLGIPEKAAEMLQAGTAYRDGGIVRDLESGRIVAFLQDADAPARSLASVNVVPLAVMGISMMAVAQRLRKIEAELRSLQSRIEEVEAELTLVQVKLDAELFGKLLSAIQSCHFDISASHFQKLADYRHVFLETYHRFRLVVADGINNPELLRRFAPVLRRNVQGMFLAGIAARDVSYRLDDAQGALQLSADISREASVLAEIAQQKLSAPSAVFWRNDEHVAFALEVRESAARLRSHELALRVLPSSEVEKIAARQLE